MTIYHHRRDKINFVVQIKNTNLFNNHAPGLSIKGAPAQKEIDVASWRRRPCVRRGQQ